MLAPSEARHSSPSSNGDGSFTLAADGAIDWTRRAPSRPSPELTPRQNQFLAAYVRTPSLKVVAAALGVSEQTAKNHAVQIRARLGVITTIDAFREIGWLVAP